jgi:hypothetical protein
MFIIVYISIISYILSRSINPVHPLNQQILYIRYQQSVLYILINQWYTSYQSLHHLVHPHIYPTITITAQTKYISRINTTSQTR